MHQIDQPPYTKSHQQRGMSLVIVLIILGLCTILGVAAVQISLLGEKGARNERDYQIAWQASEAGLTDAEFDIDLKGENTSTRSNLFNHGHMIGFTSDCGDSGQSMGLCIPSNSGKPIWLTVDFDDETTPSVAYGTFTNKTFDYGDKGIKPKKPPRYIIEVLTDNAIGDDASIDNSAGADNQKFVYRITSIGYGPREDIQAITQSIYRK